MQKGTKLHSIMTKLERGSVEMHKLLDVLQHSWNWYVFFVCACMCVYVSVCVRVCVRVRVCVCVCVYMRMIVCVCVYTQLVYPLCWQRGNWNYRR